MSDETRTAPKAEFAWASIAGADPEPVEVIEKNGRKGVLTIGCPDPFWLDDETAGVRLHGDSMYRPQQVTTRQERARLQDVYLQRTGKVHSWRGAR